MKKYIFLFFILIPLSMLQVKAQIFLSPYKDGRPIADSLKDFSEPKKISLLEKENSSKKDIVIQKENNNKESNTNEKDITIPDPVILNPKKNN
jgi:hypothetical protein